MAILEIQVPEGMNPVYGKDENGYTIIIGWEPAPPIRSKSWPEYVVNHPVISPAERALGICGISSGDPSYKRCLEHFNQNLLASQHDAEALSAFIKLWRLRDEWRNGWTPDWSNARSHYCILIDSGTPRTGICKNQRFLVFETREMAEEFLNCFKDLIELAKPLL